MIEADDRARVSLRVNGSPSRVFAVFTQDIELWWRRGPRFRNAAGDQGLIALEPRLRGRVFERLGVDDGARVVELGRITVWEPPHLLAFSWRNANFAPHEQTQVEVRFEASGSGTLITVTHSGWSGIRSDHPARHGQLAASFLRGLGLWWADQLRHFERTMQEME